MERNDILNTNQSGSHVWRRQERTLKRSGRARQSDERAPRAGAVTEATWKLLLNDGAGDYPVKAG